MEDDTIVEASEHSARQYIGAEDVVREERGGPGKAEDGGVQVVDSVDSAGVGWSDAAYMNIDTIDAIWEDGALDSVDQDLPSPAVSPQNAKNEPELIDGASSDNDDEDDQCNLRGHLPSGDFDGFSDYEPPNVSVGSDLEDQAN